MIRPQSNGFRDVIDVSGLWRIRFDPEQVGLVAGWPAGIGPGHPIAVPGSWNEQLAELGVMNYCGVAWYETEVFIPAWTAGRQLRLWFGSADYQADVWVNGAAIGRSGAQHLPFELPLPASIGPGQTARVVVRVDATLPDQGPTQAVSRADYQAENRPKDEYLPAVRFDFFPYGGLNRPVKLVVIPGVIDGVALRPQVTGAGGILGVSIAHQGAARFHLEAVCGAHRWHVALPAAATGPTGAELPLPGCPLWSPDAPHLVQLTVTACDEGGAPIDAVSLTTGVREVRVQGDRLLLNGQPITLKGFGKHEDSPIRGRGLDLPQLVKDFHLLDWCNANSVRTSHYPYADEFYDLCDARGILVIGEVFSINLDFRKVTAVGLEAHKAAIAQMIARDQHHPSVIAWSLSNEPGYLGESVYPTVSAPYWQEVFSHARALDPTRPLTHANVQYASIDDPVFDVSDFLMINRYYGWYTAPAQLDRAIEMLRADFDYLHHKHGKPIFVSEFGADAIAGQHATYPQLFTEDFQADFIEAYWQAIGAHPGVIGGHVWNFADFRTAQHARRAVLNLKGVFTRDRTPKKAAYRLKQLWANPSAPPPKEGGHGTP